MSPPGIPPTSLALPRGGGALRTMGEKFSVNPVTGTSTMTIPLGTSPGRGGSGPSLALVYDSGAGNSSFGLGWSLPLGQIARKTNLGVPRYDDLAESDTFVLGGAEDLVPGLVVVDGGGWGLDESEQVRPDGSVYDVRRYRPRVDGAFTRIERWRERATGHTHWRTVSRDNQTTVYGLTAESRVADPADPVRRVFSWLICESYDDKGNALVYEYVPEDSAGVDVSRPDEQARTPASRAANRYIKRIKYGNRTPREPGEDLHQRTDWMFEVVFDYGDHAADPPAPEPDRAWPVRPDAFSDYRAGFETRTYRLCCRVLMFHHFPDEPETGTGCLVHSTDLGHETGAIVSYLRQMRSTGWRRQADGTYSSRRLPPLEFEYARPVIDDSIRTLDEESLHNLPIGVDGGAYVWADLDGAALPSILTEAGGAWFVKANLGGGRFGPAGTMIDQPSSIRPRGGLADIDGDGRLEAADPRGPVPGFYERTAAGGWTGFRAFTDVPAVDFADPHVYLADLTGDGTPDILVIAVEEIIWYPNLGERGFGPAERVGGRPGESGGPEPVYADGREVTVLADMSGDGLPDLVRLRNGQIAYWPNLGHGRFGAKVVMAGGPWFDAPDQFDPGRVRFADVDGSGSTDVIYLGRDGPQVYFNECGNGWSAPHPMTTFPPVDDASGVTVADLLGNGTACLVWSSPLPDAGNAPLRYIDLMGGVKPHLLVEYRNNLGASTRVTYASSVYFAALDRDAGEPWATTLPYPVHCVREQETRDAVTGFRFVNSFTYGHGCFDPVEREFRGFCRIRRTDTETYDRFVLGGSGNVVEEHQHQPPVYERTWHHPGMLVRDGEDPTAVFEREFYPNDVAPEHRPPPLILPSGLTGEEHRQALAAARGVMLRQETFSPDGSAQSEHPYWTARTSYEVRMLQPRGPNRHACFLVSQREGLTYHYERDPADPRVAHNLTLDIDELGNIVRAASVGYPRLVADPALPAPVRAAQQRRSVIVTETDYTNDVVTGDAYRLRGPCAIRSYELTGAAPAAGGYHTRADLTETLAGAAKIAFEDAVPDDDGVPRLRQLSERVVHYLRDDITGPLPVGELESLGLAHSTRDLAFTPTLLAGLYGDRIGPADLAAAGYVQVTGHPGWWIQSGTPIFAPDPPANFYQLIGARDPYGQAQRVTLDRYALLVETATDAAGNVSQAHNDYRLLGPDLVTDPNGNQIATAADELGNIVKIAAMGKPGSGDGDTLADPTVQVEYDLDNWMLNRRPAFSRTLRREEFGAANPRFHESRSHFSGGGGVVLTKVQAEPGLARRWNPATGTVEEVDTSPGLRWIGSGRQVLNNKGNLVAVYEPYFSTTPGYEDATELVAAGVTPLMFYDPLGRPVRTERPDGTYSRLDAGPWQVTIYDPNDTVLDSRWYTDRGSPDPATEPEPAGPQRRAAWLAAQHGGTPTVTHSDALGRMVCAVADNGTAGRQTTRAALDLTGATVEIFDAKDRRVALTRANLAGTPCRGESPERGSRWVLAAATGEPALIIDSAGRRIRYGYDVLRRAVEVWLTEQAGGQERLIGYQVYGERHPDAAALNLRGLPLAAFDQAGAVRSAGYDFAYNPVAITRRLAAGAEPDWTSLAAQADLAGIDAAAEPLLDAEKWTGSGTADALGRPKTAVLPDGTEIRLAYDLGSYVTSLSARIGGQGPFVDFLTGQDHDAKGRRTTATLGNGTVRDHIYDPLTFRLTRSRTRRPADGAVLQDLDYVHDPVGNVVESSDAAQQTLFFAGAIVPPRRRFAYDAIYQLIKATARESAAAGTGRDASDIPAKPLPHPSDTAAVRNYTETYQYDEVGNLLELKHTANGGSWTQRYKYGYQSDPADLTNRLLATSLPGDAPGAFSATYGHDQLGNMTSMPHLAAMTWNALDQLSEVDLGGGGSARYDYGGAGQRMRKTIQRIGGIRLERLYLGPLEVFREFHNGTLAVEHREVQICAPSGEIARVDTKTVDTGSPAGVGDPVIRYTYGDNLGSVVLETDETGALVSYEEYHPFGTTAYRSGAAAAETSLKRYRFLRRERDDETGLYHCGARYYAPWLGRWTSADPTGFADGLNLYQYARNNPATMADPNGTDTVYPLPPELQPLAKEHTAKAHDTLLTHLRNTPYEVNGQPSYITGDLTWQETEGQWYFNPTAWRPVGEGPFPSDAGKVSPDGSGGDRDGPDPNAAETARQGVRAGAERSIRAPDTPTSHPPSGVNTTRSVVAATHPEAARPVAAGQQLEGPYNLWSQGDVGFQAAARRPGFVMEDTVFEAAAEARAIGKGFTGRYDPELAKPINKAKFNDVWHPTSDALATRVGLAEMPATSNGIMADPARGVPTAHGNPGATVQGGREIPKIRAAGGAMSALGMAAGAYTIYQSSQIDNPGVAGAGAAAGVGEIAAGASYVTGTALLGKSQSATGLMKFGSVGGRVFGGAGMLVLGGYGAYESFQAGDTAGGVFNTIGAAGGAALIASGLITAGVIAAAPAVATGLAIAGVAAGVVALGFGLGRLVDLW